MRNLPAIQQKWQSGGPYVGDLKPTTRVTVQMPWPDLSGVNRYDFLRRTSSSGIGSSTDRGVPMRWWQNKANSQGEMEIPNIATVSVDRSIDQDAATFKVDIRNQWMYLNGAAPTQSVTGQPGYLTPSRGDSMDEAQWGHSQNEWHNMLVPNAVIRIYTGFGGQSGDIDSQVATGNLCLYFVGLVDDVSIGTSGVLSINGRDMMKLLIEQYLFPPLVPPTHYPVVYERWIRTPTPVKMASKQVVVDAGPPPSTLGVKRTVYEDSSQDRWYGSNAAISGHRATDSLDGNQHTYALSVGNSGPDRPFSTVWWQYSCNEAMNAVHVHPWAGNYVMYVSIREGGNWVAHPSPPAEDAGVVPYDPSHLFATQSPAVDTGAAIPYVAKFVVPHETARDYVLPRTYNAQSVRVSFRKLAYSGVGVWKYRAGIREFRCMGVAVPDGAGAIHIEETYVLPPFCQAADALRVPDKLYSQGYLTVSNFDQTDAFGDARQLPVSGGSITPEKTVTAVRYTPTGKGYYVLAQDGTLRAHGDAVHYGQPTLAGSQAAWDMAVTHTGEGYWILTTNGIAHGYGDAAGHAMVVPVESDNALVAVSIEAHPSAYGFWTMRNDGQVYTYGASKYHGGAPLSGPNALQFRRQDASELANFTTDSEAGTKVRCTSTGNGYWILTSKGRVYAFGDAVNYGQPDVLEDHSQNFFTQSYWNLLPAPDDKGYILVHGSGKISPHGEIEVFGGPVPGSSADVRSDGNYLDYTDIVRDLLLWSGFLLYDPSLPSNQPAPAYAGLETTGAFAKERLPDEMFDKKPVIDAITALKEVVGYITYVDSQGRFVFRSPNWWHIGNFTEEGQHQEFLLDIDERHHLTDYTLSFADDSMRSVITISSHDPYADMSGTVTSVYQPPSAAKLRGIVKPAMWVNDFFIDPVEQQIMAELIGLHITFQERVGRASCLAYPGLEVDDQIRIVERQTGETYVHYVRGISFSHDLDSGSYKMDLTTHWLAAGTDTGDVVGGETMPVSSILQQRIQDQQFGKFKRDPAPGTI